MTMLPPESQTSANKPRWEEGSLILGTAVSEGRHRGPGHRGSALLRPALPRSCCCTGLVPIAHTSTGFLAWIIISFARDLENTQSIFHYGFLHNAPWSGFMFYCLCFIFMCFPTTVMFSLSPLMKSLSLLTVFKFSNDIQACSHSLYVFTLLCPRCKPTPNEFPFQDVNIVPVSHIGLLGSILVNYFSRLLIDIVEKILFMRVSLCGAKMPLTCF